MTLQPRQTLNLLFKLVHRLLRELGATMIELGHEVHGRMQGLPGHRASIGQHCFNRIEENPARMRFQDTPASLYGMVLAVIGGLHSESPEMEKERECREGYPNRS